MSTAAAWDTLPVHAPKRRPRLVLIDGDAGRGSERTLAATLLSIPRWVRLAITLSVLAVALSLALGVVGAGAATAPPLQVEVRSGQTLSEIARVQLPDLPTAEAVARLQLANNLPSSHIRAGQVLIIPSS